MTSTNRKDERPKQQNRPLAIWIDDATIIRLKSLARANDRSVSAEVRRAIRAHLERARQPPSAPMLDSRT